MNSDWASFLVERLPDLWQRTGEHLILTAVPTAIAIAIGVPLGILAARTRWLRGPLLGMAGILQTIPSLAMLALLLALLQQIGSLPAIIALTLYALLPIVRNTLAGLESVSAEIVEASLGIGMTYRQQLWLIKLPLALPVIMAGIRTAAVISVGIATLAAFIGAGGLGQFITRGLALSDTRLILLGAVPAGLLALLVDGMLAATEWSFRPTPQRNRGGLKEKLKPLAMTLPALLVIVPLAAYWTSNSTAPAQAQNGLEGRPTIRIGTKNFTEQFILGHLIEQLIEAHTNLEVERDFGLGGTMISHEALVSGEIDLYPEYTGTALTTILKHEAVSDLNQVMRIVRQSYQERWDVQWLVPFAFNNTYTITVRESAAVRYGWEKISDLIPMVGQLTAGFTSEFMERPDGYPGLQKVYGLSFGAVRDMETTLMYEAIRRRAVDVICAFATDGRIAAYDLKPLQDNRKFFPAYHAAPVVRSDVLRSHPEIRSALLPLADLLDDPTMRRLNYEVDENKRSPREVAHQFLISNDLLE